MNGQNTSKNEKTETNYRNITLAKPLIEVLLLRLDGKSIEEIAEITNVPTVTAKNRLAFAVAKLQNAIKTRP